MRGRWLAAAGALLACAALLALLEPRLLGDPLGPRRGGALALLIQHGPVVCGWAALVCLAGAFGLLARLPRPRVSWPRIGSALTRGVPILDARTVALFRIVFAAGVWFVLDDHRIDGAAAWQALTRAALVCFGAGLRPRLSLAVASGGVFWWMLVWTERFGTHPVAPLVVALPCLLPARWSDAWSVDALLGGRRAGPPSKVYGYAVWMPMAVASTALLAAAVAKLLTPGWIENGTVKFAFVADYHRAAVPWGLWVASQPAAAVAVSAAAVVVEGLAITALFVRSWIYRLAVGAAIAALFAGFYLLQGELWWGWWLLLLGFLPWELIAAAAPAHAPLRATRFQELAIVLLFALQATASAFRLEVRPALSAYDMYSTTFESTALFDEANPMLEYRFEAATPDEQWVDLTDCFERPANRDEAAAWARNPELLRGYLETCERPLPPRLERLRLIESHRQFDWRRGTFTWQYRDRQRWMVPL